MQGGRHEDAVRVLDVGGEGGALDETGPVVERYGRRDEIGAGRLERDPLDPAPPCVVERVPRRSQPIPDPRRCGAVRMLFSSSCPGMISARANVPTTSLPPSCATHMHTPGPRSPSASRACRLSGGAVGARVVEVLFEEGEQADVVEVGADDDRHRTIKPLLDAARSTWGRPRRATRPEQPVIAEPAARGR